MRMLFVLLALLAATGRSSAASWVYSGELLEHGIPAHGTYTLRVTLHDDAKQGAALAPAQLLQDVVVANGRFLAEIEIESDASGANALWAATEVGDAYGVFHPLAERVPLQPKGLACWATTGNADTVAGGNFLGTTDAQPLELRVNGARALRLDPATAGDPDGSPIVIGGHAANRVLPINKGDTLPAGVVIAGGGTAARPNEVASATFATISGGLANTTHSPFSTIGGGEANTIERSSLYATIAGGESNLLMAEAGTIGGGVLHSVEGHGSTVSGGISNAITGTAGAIGGGEGNIAEGIASTVSGGLANTASGSSAAIGGGFFNIAVQGATVPGGTNNHAGGSYSFAGGRQAVVRSAALSGDVDGDEGSFVWADQSGGTFQTTGPNQFIVRAAGGAGINGAPPLPSVTLSLYGSSAAQPGSMHLRAGGAASGHSLLSTGAAGNPESRFVISATDHATTSMRRLEITGGGFIGLNRLGGGITQPLVVGTDASSGNGAFLSAGGSWTNGSSRSFKHVFEAIDGGAILDRLLALPITTWRYRESESTHIGPTAEDFHAQFGFGDDPRYIGTVDADGVALASIQELHRRLQETNARLERRIAQLEAALGTTADALAGTDP